MTLSVPTKLLSANLLFGQSSLTPCGPCRPEDLRTAASAPGQLQDIFQDTELTDLADKLPAAGSLSTGLEAGTPTGGTLGGTFGGIPGEEPFKDYLQAALDNIFGDVEALDPSFGL